jgi:hypothetical protein
MDSCPSSLTPVRIIVCPSGHPMGELSDAVFMASITVWVTDKHVAICSCGGEVDLIKEALYDRRN